jgi:hypothetical protein
METETKQRVFHWISLMLLLFLWFGEHCLAVEGRPEKGKVCLQTPEMVDTGSYNVSTHGKSIVSNNQWCEQSLSALVIP